MEIVFGSVMSVMAEFERTLASALIRSCIQKIDEGRWSWMEEDGDDLRDTSSSRTS